MIRATGSMFQQRHAIRESVCTGCFMRPVGSDWLPGDIARAYEDACPIFKPLPVLAEIAGSGQSADAHAQVARRVCSGCPHAKAGGQSCPRRAYRSCPLSLYLHQALAVLSGGAESPKLRREATINPVC